MDISKAESKQGQELVDELLTLTGLPTELVQKELDGILAQSGHAGEQLTIDQLRLAMAAYLESFQAELFSDP